MIENSIRYFYKISIAVDPIFLPPDSAVWSLKQHGYIPKKCIEKNKFELIFDDLFDNKET